MHHTACACDVA